MKMLVAGVQRIAGMSKANSPFDMCNLIALVPIEPVQGKFTINGCGYKEMTLPVVVEALPQFLSQPKYPCVLDLETEPRPRGGKLETVVVGIVQLAKAA